MLLTLALVMWCSTWIYPYDAAPAAGLAES